MRVGWLRASAAASVYVMVGCAPGTPASQFVKPIAYQPEGQTKCAVRKSQSRPLIVEWPSADRAGLEALARRGVVVVRYADCEMQVLSNCRAEGGYDYVGTTLQQDEVVMRDADELYANLPLGAASLEARLQQGAQLTVSMSIVGTYAANRPSLQEQELTGSCQGATHYLRGLTVGSFDFYQEAAAELGGSAGVGDIGARGKSSSHRQSLNRAGDLSSCKLSTTKDTEPPNGCGALLRVEVEPLGAAGGAWKPKLTPDEGRLKVAVECDDSGPLGPDDGLLVSTADSGQALAPVAVAQRWNEAKGRREIDYVSFAILPGPQRVRVHAPGCMSREMDVVVDPQDPAVVTGALPPTSGTGPTARPNPWRVGVSYAHTLATVKGFYEAHVGEELYRDDVDAHIAMPGVSLTGGLATGWFTLGADLRYGRGGTTGTVYGLTEPDTGPGYFGERSLDGTLHMFYAGLRPGVRIALDPVTLLAGPGVAAAYHHLSANELDDGGFLVPLWAQLEYLPFCDFGVNVMGSRELAIDGGIDYLTVLGGISYQPNSRCRRSRRGEFSLKDAL